MSGAWYALATVAVALVVRWYLANDTGPSAPKRRSARTLNEGNPSEPK